MSEKPKRHQKVMRLRILKPAGEMAWSELGNMLRDVRYRVFRLANLGVSEAYLNFHLLRTGRAEEFKTQKIGQLNRQLRELLAEEKVGDDSLDRFSKTGALPETVVGALSRYKLRALTGKSKWRDVVRGKASLPTFRSNMSIPVRCDKAGQRRLQQTENGDIELELMMCRQPYPRVILQTGKMHDGERAILDRLLKNKDQSSDGYRQRCYEVKYVERDKNWHLFITYDFSAVNDTTLSKERVVGVDLGYSCPMYVAINNGHARLGWRQFASLAARIRSLQTQTMSRRRRVLTGGRSSLVQATARSGHGTKRRIAPIEKLEGRINDAYTTLNHQLSASVISFAKNNGAGVIQIEDLEGLQEHLTGTFLGSRWRYHQLQNFIEYKAKEAGIELRTINPRFTSRRCSGCGFIHRDFDRKFRDENRRDGFLVKFVCPSCQYDADPDYNAARNIATPGIEEIIEIQCRQQGIE